MPNGRRRRTKRFTGAAVVVGLVRKVNHGRPVISVVRRSNTMGTTFVSVTDTTSEGEIGFWMRDSVLELWLRLLALHIPEPTTEHEAAYRIRNQWLLASRGYFGGHVPHNLHNAVSTPDGRQVVMNAIESLMDASVDEAGAINWSTFELLRLDKPPRPAVFGPGISG